MSKLFIQGSFAIIIMFYNTVRKLHGISTVTFLRRFRRESKKLVAVYCRKIFLLKCRKNGVFPSFINFHVNHVAQCLRSKRNKFDNMNENFKHSVLNLCIEEVHLEERNITQSIQNIILKLKVILPPFVLADFVSHTTISIQQVKQTTQTRLEKKLNMLLNAAKEKYIGRFGPFLEKRNNWIENISNEELPEYVLRIMCLGPMFAVPYFKVGSEKFGFKPVPLEKIIVTIEDKIRNEPLVVVSKIREGICSAIQRYHMQVKRNQVPENIQVVSNRRFSDGWFMNNFKQDLKNTIIFCKRNKHIKFIKADKSNKTVVISRNDYDQKMLDLLSDKNTYKKVARSLVSSQMKKNNCVVNFWFKEGFIEENFFKHLTVSTANVAKIYGLIKLHKAGLPIRPIVSTVGAPYHTISKFFTGILSKIVGKLDSHVKNSFEFFTFINGAEIPDGFKLISFDVKSMYTNISVELAMECVQARWSEIENHCKIPQEHFCHMLKTCISSTVFQYEDSFYQQIGGLAMGGSISAVLANIVMEHIELLFLSTTPYFIYFYKRYVDDLFLCVKEDEILPILEFFNTFNPLIQFTSEIEENGCLNFLDMSLLRVNNKVLCKWYQKPTSSGRYANFLSVQPTSIKKNVAMNLARRIICLSDKSFHLEMICKGKQLLIENCYPHAFVNKIFKSVLRVHNNVNVNLNHSDISQHSEQIEHRVCLEKLVCIPYVPFLSENISAFLKHFNYQVVNTRYNTLQCLMSKLKAKTPKLQQSGVVYKIPCSNCDLSYIGQTKQHLFNRLNGHKYDKKEVTALHKHQREEDHTFNFEEVEILCREKRDFPRLLLEMIEIIKHEGSVCNSRGDVQKLAPSYHAFFNSRTLSGGDV